MRLKSKSYFIPILSILLLLSLILPNLSCITINMDGKPNASEQQAAEEKDNSSGSLITKIIDGIRGILTKQDSGQQSIGQSTGPTRPHPPVRTGSIVTDPPTQIISETVSTSGGVVAVNKPGDAMNGFVIDVPAQSFTNNRTFKVSTAPIKNQTFGSDINPITPMIIVDNGGGYSDEIMLVRIPVNVPQGKFSMAFFYDDKTKQLEGMPMASRDAGFIVVATRHFSNFFVSMIDEAQLFLHPGDAQLLQNVDSGFRPGVDDWQFPNYGSYAASYGHCAGQSLSAAWYYYAAPDGRDACLFGRYDNNGEQPETPDFWNDDSLGYRFASTVHMDIVPGMEPKWIGLAGKYLVLENNTWVKKDCPGIGDRATLCLFIYSMKASKQPQLISVISSGGSWHTMICFEITEKGILKIADPNYPGMDGRNMEFVDGAFKPYSSAANKAELDAGKGTNYERIIYYGAWTLVPFDRIAQRWNEFKAKTIGNDVFPAYKIQYKNPAGQWADLTDGMVLPSQNVTLAVTSGSLPVGAYIYHNGKELDNANGVFFFKPGKNKYGFYVVGKINNQWKYVDFKYLTLTCGSLVINPDELAGEIGMKYTFTAKTTANVTKPRFEWKINDTAQKSKINEMEISFDKEGTYSISCKLYDDGTPDKKLIGEGTASAKIAKTSSGSTPAFLRDMKYISFVLNPKANCVHDNYLDDRTKKDADTQKPPKMVVYEMNIPVTWSGVNFSGKYNGKPDGMRYMGSVTGDQFTLDLTLNGTVSSDGKTITKMKMNMVYTKNDGTYTEKWAYDFNDIPFILTTDMLKDSDPALRTLRRQFEVYSTNNPAAHGTFTATYRGPPEQYFSLNNQQKMSTGTGTCRNCQWENYTVKDLGPIRFVFKNNQVILNGL